MASVLTIVLVAALPVLLPIALLTVRDSLLTKGKHRYIQMPKERD